MIFLGLDVKLKYLYRCLHLFLCSLCKKKPRKWYATHPTPTPHSSTPHPPPCLHTHATAHTSPHILTLHISKQSYTHTHTYMCTPHIFKLCQSLPNTHPPHNTSTPLYCYTHYSTCIPSYQIYTLAFPNLFYQMAK